MTSQELIKAIKDNKISLTTLNKGKAYVIEVECGDLSTAEASTLGLKVRDSFNNLGFKDFIVVPVRNGVKSLNIKEKGDKNGKRV